MSETLEELLTDLSVWTWNFLDGASQVGFSPSETTVTETLLIELAQRGRGRVVVRKSTQVEEGLSGADFACAIEVIPSLWLNLLVQAKKLDQRTGRYNELGKNHASVQAAHLRQQAMATGAAAIYLFYNGETLCRDGDRIPLGGCTNPRKLTRRREGFPWYPGVTPAGCTIVSVEDVETLLAAGRNDPSFLSGAAAPWECLLCPFGGGGGRPRPLPWPEWVLEGGPIEGPTDLPWLGFERPSWANVVLTGDGAPEDAPGAPVARSFVVIQLGDQHRFRP